MSQSKKFNLCLKERGKLHQSFSSAIYTLFVTSLSRYDILFLCNHTVFGCLLLIAACALLSELWQPKIAANKVKLLTL